MRKIRKAKKKEKKKRNNSDGYYRLFKILKKTTIIRPTIITAITVLTIKAGTVISFISFAGSVMGVRPNLKNRN